MNNFDQSSSGINLELSCYYDSDLSIRWFEESLSNLYYDGGSFLNTDYRNVNCWLYHNGTTATDFDLTDLDNYQFTKKDLFKLVNAWDYEEAKDLAQSWYDKSLSKLTKAELSELLTDNVYEHDKIDFYTEYLQLKAFVVSSRGYCQGDYVEVVIPFNVLDDLGVNYKAKGFNIDRWLGDSLDHLFWDSPIYCRLNINDNIDNELYLDELLDCLYAWDKDLIINRLKEQKESLLKGFTNEQQLYIIEWLESNLPIKPKYQ